jgi:hypothetical protein
MPMEALKSTAPGTMRVTVMSLIRILAIVLLTLPVVACGDDDQQPGTKGSKSKGVTASHQRHASHGSHASHGHTKHTTSSHQRRAELEGADQRLAGLLNATALQLLVPAGS